MSRVRTKDAGSKRRKSLKANLDLQLQELTCLLVRVLKAVHFTDSQITAAIARACEKENPKLVTNPSIGYDGLISNVVRRWMEDPRFVGTDGRPKTLPLKGRSASFAKLVKETIPGVTVDDCLRGLINTGAVLRVGPHKVRCLRSATAISSSKITFVDEILHPIEELLRNMNWTAKYSRDGGEYGPFHRGIIGIKITRKDYAELRRMVSAHGMSFLEMIDAWAVQRSSERARRTDKKANKLLRPYLGIFLSPGKKVKNR